MDELAHCLPATKSESNQMDSDKENGENENDGIVNGNGMGVTNGELLLSNKLNNLELQIKRVRFSIDSEIISRSFRLVTYQKKTPILHPYR